MLRPNQMLLVAGMALLASCSSVSNRFEIRAVNAANQPVKCLVIIDRKWPVEGEKAVYTNAVIKIPFQRDTVNITVKPARTNAAGKIIKVPGELDPAEYQSGSRDIKATDPKIQLFILVEDPTYGQGN